jgi:2-polyprenyl-3-methyl-5-hydroxy-6-metoxy-1,4-benzoquinol methylase
MPTADRPLERRATVRTAVVSDALEPLLAARAGQDVVDIGGGTGGFAVRIAEAGHRVTVVDPSPDALAAAARRADESGVSARVVGHQGELADLPALVGDQAADLVLCHGVLGIVEDPAAAVAVLAGVLRPGGWLSLLVAQRHAAVIHRAMAGHLGQARELLDGDGTSAGERRFTAEECRALLADAGLDVHQVSAVRVFSDLVPAAVLESEPGAAEALLALERAVADRSDYQILGAQLHLLARR